MAGDKKGGEGNNGEGNSNNNNKGNENKGTLPKVSPPARNSRFPVHDPDHSIEHYLNRIEYWFMAEGIPATDEYQRFVTMMAQLPPKFFDELAGKDLRDHPTPYTKAKETLMGRFSMNEFDRVERLLARVEAGDKSPGDILQEMRMLNATTDESILIKIWLRRIPRDIAAHLIDYAHLPIDELRSRADLQYSMHYDQRVQAVTHKPPATTTVPASLSTPAGIPELVQMMQQMMLLMQEQNARTIAAVNALTTSNNPAGRGRSRQRSQNRARSQSRGLEDNGQCWYHNEFGADAQRCRPGCIFGNKPPADRHK